MLDYEIRCYKVQYISKDCDFGINHKFFTEEEALSFIKNNRHKWRNYRLLKIQSAIITKEDLKND